MNKILLLLSITLIYSCSVQQKNKPLHENYSSREKPSEYNLQLRSDSTFVYKVGFNGNLIAECKGSWKYLKQEDSIKLYCEEQFLSETLSHTYMSERVNSFKISKKGKVLKSKNIILDAQ